VTYLLFDGVLFVLNFGHWYLKLEISMILFNRIIFATPNSYVFICSGPAQTPNKLAPASLVLYRSAQFLSFVNYKP
jgi:hypothetical protein